MLYDDDRALIYAINGDTRFSAAAIEEAMKVVRTNADAQSGHWRLNHAVLTYDWCYDQFTEAQRDSVIAFCLYRLNAQAMPGVWHRAQDLRWQYALAIYGEAGRRTTTLRRSLKSRSS